jgi:pimeloyl-ACP methyl ester carboxylesterase
MSEISLEKSAFVLVHGAWHGAWCWRRITPLLEAAGHRSIATSCRGVGERADELTPEIGLDTYVSDVIAVIESAGLSDVVLVGHSHGGWIVAGVADRIPERIAKFVFLDANLVGAGSSQFSTLAPELLAARRAAARLSPGGLSMPPPPASAFGITNEADIAWVDSQLTPQPLKTYEDALQLEHPLGNGLPRTYIACVEPPFSAVATAHQWAKAQPDWHYLEIATGHDAMVIAPELLAATLLGIAGS